MTVKLFQNMIYQFKDQLNERFGVLDDKYNVIACSDEKLVGTGKEFLADIINPSSPVFITDGCCYRPVYIRNKLEFIVFIESDSDFSIKVSGMLCVSLNSLRQLFDEKFDKLSFIKNVLRDSILPGDIHSKAKELKLTVDAQRVVFVVRLEKPDDGTVLDILSRMFPQRSKDFIVATDERSIAVIKEISEVNVQKEADKYADVITDTLLAEAMIKIWVGIGTVVSNIRDIALSYREACVALDIGKVFDSEKTVVSYDRLGIGRLIYQLPVKMCQMFLDEVFKNDSFNELGSEMVFTIQKFFENNLNISETSRKLFVHRNTLIYRLDKIQKTTGLDLRKFDDAIIFKVAMMVKKYLSSNVPRF